MARMVAILIAIALPAGCGRTVNNDVAYKESAAYPADTDVASTIDSLDRMLAAKSEYDRFAAAWPIVLSQSTKTETRQNETDAPVLLSLELAADPHEWSSCIAARNVVDGTDASTIRIELATFMGRVPWKPTKDVYTKWMLSEPGGGESDLLQWHLEDRSNETIQEFTLKFRLKLEPKKPTAK